MQVILYGHELLECVLRVFRPFPVPWLLLEEIGPRVLSSAQNGALPSDDMRLRRRLLSCVDFLGSAVEFV